MLKHQLKVNTEFQCYSFFKTFATPGPFLQYFKENNRTQGGERIL
jgi:hypothetical protein